MPLEARGGRATNRRVGRTGARETGVALPLDPAGQATRASATAPTVVCGHVHPVVRIPGIAGRHPAFVIDAGELVLPAFSAFTGGWLVTPDSLRFACVRGHLLRMPPQVKRDRR